MFGFGKKTQLVTADEALPGRSEPLALDAAHFINHHSMTGPFPENMEKAVFALGCFWGAERKFWTQDGVYVTAVGYIAGHTLNPTYEEVCSGKTGHTEAVLVVFDPAIVSYSQLLTLFWESHNPTQGMRQGNDQGTQYRSGIYTFSDQQITLATASAEHYQQRLTAKGHTDITTEIQAAGPFFYAETYHQQYLGKNPAGYCGLGGCDVSFD
ncbi:Peptide methionine sulfoxide reductase MsrA [BD1-7 clade bacterium]|uniref:Peptide methionine sulfoxide reductase MsrA n=1 Tax=BD1-7 clade bacterium TaxID=2029982 RepID=A0A5S9PMB6_9GAMM|nr:Peptide methionine sulfoxide reductase MsrA [BD1-7 clade bacterium]CAA0105543.1 Peptide methionine sulfoxide reductase MsrA [BD1-7 clade bacterium]